MQVLAYLRKLRAVLLIGGMLLCLPGCGGDVHRPAALVAAASAVCVAIAVTWKGRKP